MADYRYPVIQRPSFSRQLRRTALLFVALCTGIATHCARAVLINGEGPANVTGVYDRFNVGSYPGTPVSNPTFFAAGFDLSGIGWVNSDPNQSITLVSPQYFVGASHLFPGAGSTLQFFGTNNSLYSASVASSHRLTYTGTNGAQLSDLTIGRLTASLPSFVTPMPIFYAGATDFVKNPSSFNAYAGISLYNYGHTARMGINGLDGFTQYSLLGDPVGSNIGLVYTQGSGAGETLLEGGDSGSPTLAYRDGVYGLIGTHSGIDPTLPISYDAFVSYTSYVDQMNAIFAQNAAIDDGNQSLILVVPEPGMFCVGIALLGICAARRTRRMRQEL